MSKEEFIEVCIRGDFNIKRISGNFFLRQGWKTYSFPLLTNTSINKELIDSLKWKTFISVIKAEYKIKNTNEFILNSNKYDLESFNRKIRNRIKKSVQTCSFKRPSLDDMINYGIIINKLTLKKQHRVDKTLTNLNNWTKYITSIYSNIHFIILGAFCTDKMIGYLIVFKLDQKYIIHHAFINRLESVQSAPMNGLIFILINQLIKLEGEILISYGIDSIKDLPELNRFKNNMLFKKIPVTRFYLINPLILPFFKLTAFVLIGLLKRKKIKNIIARETIHIYYGHRLLYKALEKVKLDIQTT